MPSGPDMTIEKLFAAASAAREKAYAPYSGFRVGASVLCENGTIHSGANVENAAYPVGNCAEASAIAQMILSGGRQIREIMILCDGEETGTPCGACRQRIREFADAATTIHVAGDEGVRRSFVLDELLPFSFGREHLKKD
jgi:cytidine deaminase